jgi:16S rRNA (guanine527-N7)-methyltransferase
MTEDDAQQWITDHHGLVKTEQVREFVELLRTEMSNQNLIAPSTVDQIWSRHVVDSAQLLRLAPVHWKTWLDIGTGAGFPGMIVSILCDTPVTMVEPRRRRAEFLAHAASTLGLKNVVIRASKVEAVDGTFDVISARAVAELGGLFAAACGRGRADTVWLLPKGRRWRDELGTTQCTWRGKFHVERSLTDEEGRIVVAQGVHSR